MRLIDVDLLEIGWRVTNVILASIASFLLIWIYSRRWARLRTADRMIGIAFVMLLVSAAVGSVEQLIQGLPPGVRTGMVTVALAYLIWGLISARYLIGDDDR